ncbi:MAG TPA: ADOP family duplicated permease [Vicinamibacterales bacterium]
MTWWRRLLRQQALERELDAELRDHLEREIADRVRGGESDADARRQMRLTSGGLDQIKEACRDVRRPPVLADLAADVRFACRILARNGWATAGAILTLALAMGVANTIFINTYADLWRDFPFERPDRIAIMRTVDARGREAGLSFADYQDWRRDARVLDGPAAAFAIGAISLGRDGAEPEQFEGLYVSADTFSVLRVKPRLGRDFTSSDDRPGAEAVVIISSNIWKSRYAASRDVLGRQVSINGATPATIVGVMPDGIRFIDFTDVWLPLAQMPGLAAQRRDTRPLMMIGRLPDSADLERVRADLSPIAANISAAHPDTNKDIRPLVNTLLEAYNGGVTLTNSAIYMPLLAAAFVLLIAAANLANLLLARAAYRSREIAIRLAIGATRWRIVRGLLIESLVLAFVAWILAVGGSWLTLTISASQAAPQLPYWHIKMDARLLATLAAIALVTTGLFGLAPAIWASRHATADGLKEGGRLSTPPKVRRWTTALLIGQFAVTLALLNGAGLTARRFFTFYSLDRNLQTSDAVTTTVRLPAQTYATREKRIAFHDQLKARLLSAPGVTASTVASAAPFSAAGRRQLTSVDGRLETDPPPDVMTVTVDTDYFRTLVPGLVLGDSFSELHGTPGHEAAIVNQRFADVYLGTGNPIGRHIELRPPTVQRTYLREAEGPASLVSVAIIGVSRDIRQSPGDPVPMVYLPFRAEAPAAVALIVRGSDGLGVVVQTVRQAVNDIDPDLALGVVRPLNELRDRSRSGPADMAAQFARIGGLALILSGVGLYSAMAYAVRRRTQEIAVRMALGAQAAQVRWLFLKSGVWVIIAGVAIGVPGALVVGRLLQRTFVRTEARDIVTLVVTIVLLAIVALVASIIPARRATRLEPIAALRIE